MSVISALERVRRTAFIELEQALSGLPRPARIVIGLLTETPEILTLSSLQTLTDTQDAFVVALRNETLFLVGTTPRGMLQAVYALRDYLATGGKLDEGLKLEGVFHFSQRIFHARFQPWPGERADVRFIAQMGATHCLVTHDWQGNHRSLQGYVTSPIFPDAVPAAEVAANRAGLRRLLDDCADHGLGAMLWLTELPCQGGPWISEEDRAKFLTRYSPEVFSDSGTYEGQVLCFGHERVREFYRDIVGRFFADFPEIETLFIFGLDSGGEFCDPDTCPRCRGMSRFAQRDRLLGFLIDEGNKVRPGLRVLTTGWGWDRDAQQFLHRQVALPPACGVYQAAQQDGWQCERQSHDFLREVREVCRERGQLFIGYDDFHWGDDTVHGLGDIQDFPLGIAAKLRRWHALGADGVFDHWGNSPEQIWTNSIACREFFLNPEADSVVVCGRLAERQFGKIAGTLALSAWQAIERAHEGLSKACTWAPGQWPMWYGGRSASPIPDEKALEELRRSQLAPRRAGDVIYNPVDFGDALQAVADAWRAAAPHYADAGRLLGLAREAADDSPVFYHFWWNGNASSPTRREHLRQQQLYVVSMAVVGREIGLQFELYALWERVGHDVNSYQTQAEVRLREDAAACHTASRFFGSLEKPKDWGALYAAKAERIEKFLG